MTTMDFEPLTVAVPLWEDPPAFGVGNSRVLLECDPRLPAGATPRASSGRIGPSAWRTCTRLSPVTWRTPPPSISISPVRRRGRSGRRQLESAGMTNRVSKEELLARARAKGLIP